MMALPNAQPVPSWLKLVRTSVAINAVTDTERSPALGTQIGHKL